MDIMNPTKTLEEFIAVLHNDIKTEPLKTLNIVLSVFTVISFTNLCVDIFNRFSCSKNKDDKIDAILEIVEKLPNNEKMEELDHEIAMLHIVIERMHNYIMDIHQSTRAKDQEEEEQVCNSQDGQEEEQVCNSEDSQDASNCQVQPTTQDASNGDEESLQPINGQEKDKHYYLIEALNDGDDVYLTYKKQTFQAKFVLKEDAQHGYVLVSNNVEYNTPSHFSFAMKSSINKNITSDNGWDSLHILTTNEKGKQKKVALNLLIASLQT